MQELFTLMDLHQESEFNIDEVVGVLDFPGSFPGDPNFEAINGMLQ
jgi:hypothetical protein